MGLNGETIIVTGASSGIGEAAAKLLAQHGANVVLGARRLYLLRKHAHAIETGSGHALAVAGDVEEESYHAGVAGVRPVRTAGRGLQQRGRDRGARPDSRHAERTGTRSSVPI